MTRGKRVRKRFGWRWLTAVAMAISLLSGIIVAEKASAQSIQKPRRAATQGTLSKYSWDLTAAAAQGRFDAFTERREETSQAIKVLSNSQKNNPVILTDSQAVRDLVTSSVARRIATGDVPEALYGKRLLKLNLDLLFHDSANAAELIKTLSAILSEASQSDSKTILLIDPIQALVGSSAAFALLREAIIKGDVQCLGASTEIIFQENLASDQSLAALFTGIEMQDAANAGSDDTKAGDSVKTSGEEFVGDKVSSDLRELIDSRNAPSRVKAILQVDDTN